MQKVGMRNLRQTFSMNKKSNKRKLPILTLPVT